jgi:predicted nucleotidyltransferase
LLESLVEGYFVKTLDNLIFEVKGIVHPNDRIIAYVRYVPNIVSSETISGFRKIYDLYEREEYLKKYHSEYLWFSEAHGRILQAVPHKKVMQILNPVSHMVQIRENSSALAVATSNLVDLLLEYTGISRQNIGVTGSQLVGVARETSDIDLVVFGKTTCDKFYRKLSESYDKIPGIERYQGELLNEHVKFRWGDLVTYQDSLREIERKKILQGVFRGHQFFIRLVKYRQDVSERFGQKVSKNLRTAEVQCKITDDRNSIFTPCSYQVKSSELSELIQIVSYRGRFTEHVLTNQFVNVRGRLESVVDKSTGERYQQLVLGEDSSDYMMPQ